MFRACLLFLATLACLAAPPRTLRVDYGHTGDARSERFGVDRVVLEPLPWPGDPAQAIDTSGLVIYIGTFSKILFPGLRLGWLVAPRPGSHVTRANICCMKWCECSGSNARQMPRRSGGSRRASIPSRNARPTLRGTRWRGWPLREARFALLRSCTEQQAMTSPLFIETSPLKQFW